MATSDHPPEKNSVMLVFTTILQGAATGGMDTIPFLRLIRTDAQRTALAVRLNTSDLSRLNVADLSNNVIIAAFQGLKPTSGYRVDIFGVEAHGNTLDITIKQSLPALGEFVRQGFETPYHLVQVARNEFDGYHFPNYRLRDISGDVLTEGIIESLYY